MLISKAQPTNPKLLISHAQYTYAEYGPKFQKFSEQIAQKFERILKISVKSKKKDIQDYLIPCMLFTAILLKKAVRGQQDPDFNRRQFLDDIRFKSKQILNKLVLPPDGADRFFEWVGYALNDVIKIHQLLDSHYRYVYELINFSCERKTKELQEISNYSPEEINKIGNVFKQKIFFINYDDNKDALEKVPTPLDHRTIYLLKAKKMFFILFKLQDIAILNYSKVTHEELAAIFNITNKLENQPVKESRVQGTQELIQSRIKQPQSPIKVQQPQYLTIDISPKQPQPSSPNPQSPLKSGLRSVMVSKLKSTTLFPQQVKCKYCCRKISQFNTLYWNYESYCLECIVNPKIDVTFVPANLIKKFLKNMHYDNNSPYQVICPECKAEGTIKNYRVENKPKEYQCNTCQKVICIEHQRLILECFCYCMGCKKQTITVGDLFQKYCPTCKIRLCELCNKKSNKDCECLCKDCGEPDLADHNCHGRCHACQGTALNLRNCPCSLKLCPMCYFRSLQPNEQICAKTIKTV